MQRILLALLTVLSFATAAPASADPKTDERLKDATNVFEAFTDLSEQAVPTWLLERAYGIVVVPKVVKGALFVGGRRGSGVMAVRNTDGSWTNPVFVTITGLNIGFQFGLQATDLVLVLMSRNSVEGISGGKVTLGADASVAAGPIGRAAAATTDATLKAQVLSYSRSEGLFAGIALDGSVLSIDDKANQNAYGVPDILASQILRGEAGQPSAAAVQFKAALTKATDRAAVATSEPAPTPPAPPLAPKASGAATPPAPAEGGAQTYPMEDPNPGAPPPPN